MADGRIIRTTVQDAENLNEVMQIAHHLPTDLKTASVDGYASAVADFVSKQVYYAVLDALS